MFLVDFQKKNYEKGTKEKSQSLYNYCPYSLSYIWCNLKMSIINSESHNFQTLHFLALYKVMKMYNYNLCNQSVSKVPLN